MITMSVQDVIERMRNKKADLRGYWLYMIRDEDIVLYVGQGHIYDRLTCHVRSTPNTKPSRIGRAIRENMPYSLGWQITVYMLEECAPFVHAHNPALVDLVQRGRWNKEAVDLAEYAMIKYFKPCLNIRGVVHAHN